MEAQTGHVFSLDFELRVLSSKCFLNTEDVTNNALSPFLRVLEPADKVSEGAHRIVRHLYAITSGFRQIIPDSMAINSPYC
jgi:hypothetical protein